MKSVKQTYIQIHTRIVLKNELVHIYKHKLSIMAQTHIETEKYHEINEAYHKVIKAKHIAQRYT